MVESSISEGGLAVIWHSRTGACEQMAGAVAGAGRDGAVLLSASHASVDDLLKARGYVFVCPENLGSMSGAMKEMFDRLYYPLLGRVEGRAYATIIAAGSDGSGAQRQLDRIVKGWRLKRVAKEMIVNFAAQSEQEILAAKSLPAKVRKQCNDLGAGMIEGLRSGIF